MQPLVSINCITYNHEKYIRQALDSFLMQKTNFKYEILIHDDASTDNTAEIIREYCKKYPNVIKPILQKENQQSKGIKKISYKFNHLRAQGKYIAICEGDDYWIDPYKLQKQIDYLESNPECGMCFHAANIVNSDNKIKKNIRPFTMNKVCSTEDIIIGGGGLCPTQSIVYRKQVFDDAPQFYFDAPVGDYPLQIITASKQYSYYIDDVMSSYRKVVKSGTSWSSTNKSKESNIKLIDQLNDMLKKFNEYSNYMHNDAIELTMLSNNFNKLILEGKYSEIMDGKYKKYYQSKSVLDKIKINIRCLFPTVYSKLIEYRYN